MDNRKDVRFDDFIDTYKSEIQRVINFSGQDVDFYIGIKADMIITLIEKFLNSASEIKALDIGSGIGLVDKLIAGKLKSLSGVDVEEGVIEKARTYNPGVDYRLYDGRKLPFNDNIFDFAFAMNVLHHVQPAEWQNFISEMHRVLKPGGMAVIFEHNPANPMTRKVVKNCMFDRDAVLLPHNKITGLFDEAGLKTVDDAYIIFFPFRGGIFRSAEKFLKWCPLGAQQYVAAVK